MAIYFTLFSNYISQKNKRGGPCFQEGERGKIKKKEGKIKTKSSKSGKEIRT